MNNLSSLDYRNIGIMLYKLHPETARHVLKQVENTKPLKTDFSEIPELFTRFCKLKGIAGINFSTRTRTKKEYVNLRLIFIGVIIKLYNPELISLPQTKMKRKLQAQLSKVLKVNNTWISQSVSTVLVRLNVYEDFSNDVITTMTLINFGC